MQMWLRALTAGGLIMRARRGVVGRGLVARHTLSRVIVTALVLLLPSRDEA